MQDLTSLLYISTATTKHSEEELLKILEVSRSNNLKAGITGVLCSGGGHFIQVIEGPQKAVLESYLSILDDTRHKDCLLIGMAPLKERNFEKWSMGYIQASEDKVLERKKLLMDYWQSQVKETELLSLMRKFVKLLRDQAQ